MLLQRLVEANCSVQSVASSPATGEGSPQESHTQGTAGPLRLQLWEPQDAVLSWEFRTYLVLTKQLPWWPSGKESAFDVGDQGSIPDSGRSPGKGNGNPPQYSCLENPTDRGAWSATVHGVTESDTTE